MIILKRFKTCMINYQSTITTECRSASSSCGGAQLVTWLLLPSALGRPIWPDCGLKSRYVFFYHYFRNSTAYWKVPRLGPSVLLVGATRRWKWVWSFGEVEWNDTDRTERKYLVEWNGMILTGRNVNIWWSGMEWYWQDEMWILGGVEWNDTDGTERKYLVEWNGMILTGRNVNIWWNGMEWYWRDGA